MLTSNECNIVLNFLNRAQITGHEERQAMNVVTQKVQMIGKAAAEEEATEEVDEKVPAEVPTKRK